MTTLVFKTLYGINKENLKCIILINLVDKSITK